MQYTAEDYNVTISRGFVREDGKMLWGRNPNLKGGLEWRTPKAYKTAVQQNRNNRGARYVEHNERINKIKLEKGCCMCGFGGSHFPKKFHQHIVMLLEFDHIDPSTKYENVSQMKNYSWDVIQSEIDKCRVLCKPCHAKHTGEQNRTE